MHVASDTPDARRLMRHYGDQQPASTAAQILGIGEEQAAEVLAEFEEQGFLQRSDMGFAPAEPWWQTTVRGGALAQASFGKPIKRATAERHLAAVLDRVHQFNADPAKLMTITQLTVFGSYLDPAVDMLGDLDLAITCAHREAGEDFVQRVLDYAHASGRHFGSFPSMIMWPTLEMLMILKNRSPAINITTEDISRFTDRARVVYRIEDDPAAIKPAPPPPATPLV
jgi:predicted nucleotidyltransferase